MTRVDVTAAILDAKRKKGLSLSAIDFKMDITREPDPKGDRVNIAMSGKFLPYKTY